MKYRQIYYRKWRTLASPWKSTSSLADNARKRDQTYNWETATHSKEYHDDLDSFTDFETDFPAIVYNDAPISNQNVSSKPTAVYTAYPKPMDTAY
nr:hypothetical protein [Tanacetum cinerariifolium]